MKSNEQAYLLSVKKDECEPWKFKRLHPRLEGGTKACVGDETAGWEFQRVVPGFRQLRCGANRRVPQGY